MDLSKILSIAGKPGLFKVIAQTKNGIVVESLLDQKRFTAFANERMSSLEEISIFTNDEDLPLIDVFKKISDKQEGKAAINHKSDGKELKAFFKEAISDYDEERVYTSDIKKVLQWYNVLLDKEILNFEEEKEEEKPKEKTEEKKEKKAVEKKKVESPKIKTDSKSK